MRKRRIYLALLLLAVAGVVLLIVAGAFREREPEYAGKKLSEWVNAYPTSSNAEQINDAIRHIGSNALPYLMKWMLYEAPPWKTNLYEAANYAVTKLNSDWGVTDGKEVRAGYAFSAFEALGAQARPAIPKLTKMLNDPKGGNSAVAAALALDMLGRDGLPPLLAVVTNSQCSRDVRQGVIYLVGVTATNQVAVAIALSNVLSDPDPELRSAATNSLEEINRSATRRLRRKDRSRKPE